MKISKKLLGRFVHPSYLLAASIIMLVIAVTSVIYVEHVRILATRHVQSQDGARLDRITAIYASLQLGREYMPTGGAVFGEKRVYEWDPSRTYSSNQTYLRQAKVNVVVADLRKTIETAGFVYFDEPYAGSTFSELHFKSSSNEYIRLNVSSKSRTDAFRHDNKTSVDPNEAPSSIIIKVNLDDNNE